MSLEVLKQKRREYRRKIVEIVGRRAGQFPGRWTVVNVLEDVARGEGSRRKYKISVKNASGKTAVVYEDEVRIVS